MSSETRRERKIRVRSKPRTEEDLRAIARVIIELALKGDETSNNEELKHGPQEKSA